MIQQILLKSFELLLHVVWMDDFFACYGNTGIIISFTMSACIYCICCFWRIDIVIFTVLRRHRRRGVRNANIRFILFPIELLICV